MISENIEKAKITVNYGNLKKEKPLVIVLMGLPGSGKSYLADHFNKNILTKSM